MNYIHHLQKERDKAQARVENLEASLIELQGYLTSPKFHNEDWVSAREMFFRIQQIRSDAYVD
jgi:hypothetical protein